MLDDNVSFRFVCSVFTEPCDTSTDDLRIAPNSSNLTYGGKLEVCQSDGWMEVCDREWNTMNAEVVCRQLGFNDSSEGK